MIQNTPLKWTGQLWCVLYGLKATHFKRTFLRSTTLRSISLRNDAIDPLGSVLLLKMQFNNTLHYEPGQLWCVLSEYPKSHFKEGHF